MQSKRAQGKRPGPSKEDVTAPLKVQTRDVSFFFEELYKDHMPLTQDAARKKRKKPPPLIDVEDLRGDCVLTDNVGKSRLWDPDNAFIVRITKVDVQRGFRGHTEADDAGRRGGYTLKILLQQDCNANIHQDGRPEDLKGDYFCDRLYDQDELHFIDLPPIFSNPDAPPEEICGCYEKPSGAWRDTPTGFDDKESLRYHKLMDYKRHRFEPGTFLTIKRLDDDGIKQEDVGEVVELPGHKHSVDAPLLAMRQFLREAEPERPNELVWTSQIEVFATWDDIVDRVNLEPVFVEFVDLEAELPKHLRYQGAGRYFYFRNRSPYCKVENYPSKYREVPESQKLECFSPMCGSGNLSFALADSGFCRLTAAFDRDKDAVQTFNARYRFRFPDADEDIAFIEDSNALLEAVRQSRQQMRNNTSGPQNRYFNFAKKRFDVIAVGLSCTSWSILNRFPKVEDRALLLNIASYVEVFQPKVFILENVAEFGKFRRWPEMYGEGAAERGSDQDLKTPVNCLLAFMLSKGFRIRHGTLHAARHGVPQRRIRYFIVGIGGFKIKFQSDHQSTRCALSKASNANTLDTS
ncbi:DNA (cytosine-5)-methyltransferase 1 [Phlyctochytrium bullatum]|nr:DNA (cytosine-5)-methyltransferase 1 [Phlyctochytrium bullatum]